MIIKKKPVLTNAAKEEIEKLKMHFNKSCLSNIGVGEALHRLINSFFIKVK